MTSTSLDRLNLTAKYSTPTEQIGMQCALINPRRQWQRTENRTTYSGKNSSWGLPCRQQRETGHGLVRVFHFCFASNLGDLYSSAVLAGLTHKLLVVEPPKAASLALMRFVVWHRKPKRVAPLHPGTQMSVQDSKQNLKTRQCFLGTFNLHQFFPLCIGCACP